MQKSISSLGFSILLSSLQCNHVGGFLAPPLNKKNAYASQVPRRESTWTFGSANHVCLSNVHMVATDGICESNDERDFMKKKEERKRVLLSLIGASDERRNEFAIVDRVLASPLTKEPLTTTISGPFLEGGARGVKVTLVRKGGNNSETEIYEGRTDTFYNLLEQVETDGKDENKEEILSLGSFSSVGKKIVSAVQLLLPPPLRSSLSGMDGAYVPMRDLFTSPAVSYAYERGWRQNFASAGFPGVNGEFELAKSYFDEATKRSENNGAVVLVDMSCASGLFTRRFGKSGLYDRVIGCDFSESMLLEARRRISDDKELNNALRRNKTRLDLVRCDVANIPIQSDSIDALHAGAAMHCWPELEEGLCEIHRVLKPGGRYFATTFLSKYFGPYQLSKSGKQELTERSFHVFESIEELKGMLVSAGFDDEKVSLEVLGPACVVIRCEK